MKQFLCYGFMGIALGLAGSGYAMEGTSGVQPGAVQAPVLQTGVRAQIVAAQASIVAAQAKLQAISSCHSNNTLYIRRNGTPQCWDPLVTFPAAPPPPPPPPLDPCLTDPTQSGCPGYVEPCTVNCDLGTSHAGDN